MVKTLGVFLGGFEEPHHQPGLGGKGVQRVYDVAVAHVPHNLVLDLELLENGIVLIPIKVVYSVPGDVLHVLGLYIGDCFLTRQKLWILEDFFAFLQLGNQPVVLVLAAMGRDDVSNFFEHTEAVAVFLEDVFVESRLKLLHVLDFLGVVFLHRCVGHEIVAHVCFFD